MCSVVYVDTVSCLPFISDCWIISLNKRLLKTKTNSFSSPFFRFESPVERNPASGHYSDFGEISCVQIVCFPRGLARTLLGKNPSFERGTGGHTFQLAYLCCTCTGLDPRRENKPRIPRNRRIADSSPRQPLLFDRCGEDLPVFGGPGRFRVRR